MQTPITIWAMLLKEQGKLEEAIEAYNKALSIKPDYARRLQQHGHCSQRSK